jgi:hypothetical protein
MKQLLLFAQKLDADTLNIPELTGDQVLQNGLNLAYFAMAIIAVIVIIVAGIMYATSGGDSAAVTKAKNLILYSIVGIVVILAAWGITNFVIGRF